MRKVINGKLYDTKTAKEIGSYWNGVSDRDFSYLCETLYRTRKGNYFLHGVGGPMSKYAYYHGNSVSGDSVIIPLTPTEAYKWAQEYLPGDTVVEFFSDSVEEA